MQDSGNNDELDPINTSADEQTVPELPGLATDGTSRRNFLKAAVVASAAVAAAGGAAGVALVSGKTPHLSQVAFSNCNPKCSGSDPCSACVTASNPSGNSQDTSVKVANANSLLFWVTNTQAKAGYYQLHVTSTASPATTPGGNSGGDITDSTTPFAIHNGNNNIYVNAFSTTTGVNACPTSGGSGGDNTAATTPNGTLKQYNTLSDLNGDNTNKGYNFTPTTGAIQFALHITFNDTALSSSPTTVTFTFSLSWSQTGAANSYTTVCDSDTYTLTLTNS